jgi:hypothetical protein
MTTAMEATHNEGIKPTVVTHVTIRPTETPEMMLLGDGARKLAGGV